MFRGEAPNPTAAPPIAVALPPSKPRRVTIDPRPDSGIDEETVVIACGTFDHDRRADTGTYSAAVHAVATGEPGRSRAFGERLRRCLTPVIDRSAIDTVTLVPAHDGGTNPALRSVVSTLDRPYEQVIERTTPVAPNKRIPALDDRWPNVEASLTTTRSLTGERVLIVDDVLASGASLAVAAATVRAAGAQTATGAVLGLRVPTPHAPTRLDTDDERRTN